jgi:tetratricopeptide (TPR) repeat protein
VRPTDAHENLLAFIDRLTSQISTNKDNADLFIQRADLYRLHENWAEAQSDYAAAQKISPDSVPLLLGIAQLRVDLKNDPAARTAFDKVISRDATNWNALFGRAHVLARLGERNAAIADYSRGLALTPAPQADQFLERASLQATESGVDDAIKGLDEGLAKMGWLVSLQNAAIDLEIKRHHPDAALARLETIIERSTRKETWLARKGEILRDAGRTQEARTAFSETLKLIEDLPPRMRTSPSTTELRHRVESLLTSPSLASAAQNQSTPPTTANQQ